MGNEPTAAGSGAGPDIAGIAERIAARRTRLGLTQDELAAKAGMAPGYLRYLLQTGPEFDPAGFLRIAAVLGTGYPELVAGRPDAPPGQHPAAAHPALVRLTEDECWDRLGGHGVGRIAVPADPAPLVLPVNYAVDAGTVVYRTDPHGPAAPRPGVPVSFQVDRVNEAMSSGWSVLVVGAAAAVEDAAEVARLQADHPLGPWAGAGRPLWVRVTPDRLTGRRIVVA
ncbi:helix-turn-helix domain-containing protein [Kitasatospora sp. NPDC059571]|uniref:helix-turn-helix domain-containing protein n=1 Tax=Kitasatospora sp. NPDC059571 TaxID=3346871 RepID=UPI0036821D8C